MKKKTCYFLGVKCSTLPRTKRHRAAVWECMLGTVYAVNDAGECRYFDYNHAAALEFAGVTPERDPRAHKVRREDNYNWIKVRPKGTPCYDNPRVGKLVLWITKAK